MVAGRADVPGDGVPVDAEQAGGLAGAHPLGGVGQDVGDGGGRQSGAEQGRAGALGEAGGAGAAAEHAGAAGSGIGGHGQVPVTPQAVVGAVEVETAEAAQVVFVHGTPSHPEMPVALPNTLPDQHYHLQLKRDTTGAVPLVVLRIDAPLLPENAETDQGDEETGQAGNRAIDKSRENFRPHRVSPE